VALVEPIDDRGLRERLLDVTADLLATDGIEVLSLREVSRRAGVSHGAPLRHFRSLAALCSSVAAEGFRRLFATVDAAVTAAGPRASAQQRLVGAAHGYAAFALANPGHFTLMFRPDLLDPDSTELIQAAPAAFAQLVDLVRAGQIEGWQTDVDAVQLAGAIWGAVHGVTSLWLQGAMKGATGARAIDDVLDPLLKLLVGSPTPRPRRPRR
jgi:AcrR family transcriptional regulator